MSDKYITLTEDNFAAEVLESKVPVVVDFWVPWCGPCRVMNKVVADLAADFEGVAKVGKLNIDDYENIASQYQIEAVPTLVFFNQGQEVDRAVSITSKPKLAAKLNDLLEQESMLAKQAA